MTDLTDFIPDLSEQPPCTPEPEPELEPEPDHEKYFLIERGASFENMREMAILQRRRNPDTPIEWIKEKDGTYILMRVENG
jgi:hypothetical protein